jgi:hypothetical protein
MERTFASRPTGTLHPIGEGERMLGQQVLGLATVAPFI